ncbi:MAG TPA: MbnP family protein [Chitinophagaceae bacterium]|nr:MbnP family protein [Chitinophagaceae bacterium]
MIKFLKKYSAVLLLLLTATSFQKKLSSGIDDKATVRLIFSNVVKGHILVLNDSAYTNPFNESYTVSKFRYYVSNIFFEKDNDGFQQKDSYHLVDEGNQASKIISVGLPAGNYKSLQFLLGVDSLHNVSGAQSGDLDPDKDMFWTWNSGYVMAKLEGSSPASAIVNHKFEYHIGGFSGPDKVLKEIRLSLPGSSYEFRAGKSYTIFITADINEWWQSVHDLKIAEHPAIAAPGTWAKEISDNYAHMFHLDKIVAE